MAEVRFLKFSGIDAYARLDPAADSLRLLSIGVGTAGVPLSGIVDANVAVNLAGSISLSFSSLVLTVGGLSWRTSVTVLAGSAGAVVLSPNATDTVTITRTGTSVNMGVDLNATTGFTINQATAASGTGAPLLLQAQGTASGTGGQLLLASGSGSVAAGAIFFKLGNVSVASFDANSNFNFAAGVTAGMVGGIVVGPITTPPSSSATNQAIIWNGSSGTLNLNAWNGVSFLIPPQGQGAGAPVKLYGYGLGGERVEAKNCVAEIFDDFLLGPTVVTATSAVVGIGWQTNIVGTGAQIGVGNTACDASHWGTCTLNTGSTATGSSGIGVAGNSITLGPGNDAIFETLINISALSTAVQEFSVSAGFSDTSGQVAPVFQGVCFQYIRTTSLNWIMFSKAAGSTTSTPTATAVATGWTKLRIQKIGTNYQFFVNGVSVGTLSTTLPGGASFVNCVVGLYSSVGTSAKVISIDYMKFSGQLGTAR